jgi:hypothetical protein
MSGAYATAGDSRAERIWPPNTKRLLVRGFVLSLIPIIALAVVLQLKQIVYLDYVHVITGATWTGFDIFMGVVFSAVMRYVDQPAKIEIAKRLTPSMVFIMPSISATSTTAGYFLATRLGIFNITHPVIIATGIIVIVLFVQGLGIFLPNELRVFLELIKEGPDTKKIVRLTTINMKLGGVQAIFQIALILMMAFLAF